VKLNLPINTEERKNFIQSIVGLIDSNAESRDFDPSALQELEKGIKPGDKVAITKNTDDSITLTVTHKGAKDAFITKIINVNDYKDIFSLQSANK
jgi:hypothetical protein